MQHKQSTSKGKPRLILIAAILCILLFATIFLLQMKGSIQPVGGTVPALDIEGMDVLAVRTTLDNKIPTNTSQSNAFAYRLNSTPTFAKPEEKGSLLFENPLPNTQYMAVEIVLDTTNAVIYRSGIIPPEYSITSDTLDTLLPEGSYAAVAILSIIDPVEMLVLSTIEEPIQITIGK